jgi:large conductance mechanosensitive channel
VPKANQHHQPKLELRPLLLPKALRGPLQGFFDFIREQGVVSLAVGLTLGIAAKSVVDSLVNNIFNPIIGLLTGGGELGSRFVCIDRVGTECTSKLGLGRVISDLLGFVIVAALVYFAVKSLKLDKLDKKKHETTE